MLPLKTIVVDDDQSSATTLIQTLYHSCPQVNVIDHFPVMPESIRKISQASPDLIFLDTGGINFSGIDLLTKWQVSGNYQFILTDSVGIADNEQLPISVTDYLSKPICPKRLTQAVEHVIEKNFLHYIRQEMKTLINYFSLSMKPKIHIPTLKGFDMIDNRKIIYAEAADNYAILHLDDGNQLLSSQNLATLECRLKEYPFLRIHRSSLINLNHVCRYIKGDGGQVVLTNQQKLNVSRAKKEELLQRLQNLFS